jgi:hypothetical protein
MDIDERLAALTQTVELLASFHRDGEKRMERLDQHMERLDQHMERLDQHMSVWVSIWSSSLKPPKA